ncbi:histidine kinase/DNA gyrase B/HSP90-like ATPase [Arcticibacter tournemirensis]|uniref:histidine kinase n=1 Tax=Arcticibacter tournemirensis TaxID=699437 RepID=A0A4Q0M7E2_9SPHI|nr:HAMP domain-containing sensor histidine kinase [Arcticibacter tournemirensis]KAA8477580.1 HAMP domain-containing histidine kinase [Arcticibacter tournemirensis]RXF69020.1 HAMP domain-containing histidine kinase [Arcticibacter tournemirensis]TQM48383.1 histidine kinase/DNA gyrase B/HSP90-like ATPase [Arcticibacter tournemirensis]
MTRLKPKQKETLPFKLLAMISHDIKIPLDNFAAYLADLPMSKPLQTGGDEIVEGLTSYVNSCRSLMDNVLFWARLHLNGYGIISQPALLRLQTDLIILSLKHQALSKRLNISNKIPEMPQVKINLSVFEFVLRNLLNNSIKFTPASGHIEIRSRTGRDSITVSVSDSGPGISADKLERIFSARKAISSSVNGSGIGLILCNDLLNICGGRIWSESTEGKGATFHFSIPAEY